MKTLFSFLLFGFLMPGGIADAQDIVAPDAEEIEEADKDKFKKELSALTSEILLTLKSVKDTATAQLAHGKLKELNAQLLFVYEELKSFYPGIRNFQPFEYRLHHGIFDEWRRLLMTDFYDCPGLEREMDSLAPIRFTPGAEVAVIKVDRAVAKMTVEYLILLKRAFLSLENVKDRVSADEVAKVWNNLVEKTELTNKLISDKNLSEEVGIAMRKYGSDVRSFTMRHANTMLNILNMDYYGSAALKMALENPELRTLNCK